jgi:hypothetical protein
LSSDGRRGPSSDGARGSVGRIDGAWKIVDKTFVHTGGEPPALE